MAAAAAQNLATLAVALDGGADQLQGPFQTGQMNLNSKFKLIENLTSSKRTFPSSKNLK
jgi:hypothetical protein